MATGIKLAEPVASGMKEEPISELVEQDAAPAEGVTTYSTSSVSESGDAKYNPKSKGNDTFGFKGVSDQVAPGEQSIHNSTISSCSYYYPGYNGSFGQVDGHGYYQVDGSHVGVQSDNGSLVYYLPGGYTPYMDGSVVGVDGQSVGQHPFFSSGYVQHPVTYGSDTVPCYSYGNVGSKNGKFGSGSAFAKSYGFSSVKSNENNSNNGSKSPKSVKPLYKVSAFGSDLSGSVTKRYNHVGKFSSNPVGKQGSFSRNGPMNYRQNGRIWNGNDRDKSRDRFHKINDHETSPELTCGPRGSNKSASLESPVKEDVGIMINMDQYNQPEFETVYTNAKFYVIKSYNEDDIHKSIKYNVWSSTPNGNKKLDAAFRDAELKSTETGGAKCPIFLFFSVNASGQFVGVAEMIGQVDFDKDMDFWQLDKWNGFFPVKWHVIKDVPNNHLRHIILENNERRPVTFSRDTQEIPLKQGLALLNIFKSYAAKTSLVDDFNFYENREKTFLSGKKLATLRMEELTNSEFAKNNKDDGRNFEDDMDLRTDTIINMTRNMTLNGHN